LIEIVPPTDPERVAGAVRGVRRRIARDLAAGEETPGTRVVRALILGDRAAIPESWQRGLRRFGLSHLLALSGLHVALIGGLLWWVGRAVGPRAQVTLTGGGILLYLAIAGAGPALQRAAAMALLAIIARRARRPPDAVAALAAAAIGLVARRPATILDLGPQLTLAATAGLLLVTPRLEARWQCLPPLARRSLAATVAAQIATWPWILPRFHLLAPLAPLANLVAVPWLSLVLILSALWVPLAWASPSAGEMLMDLLDPLASALSWPARPATGALLLLPVAISACAAVGIAVLTLGALLRGSWRSAAAAGLGLWLVTLAALGTREAPTEVVMIDVGQGDALLLRSAGAAILVDGGGWRRGDLGGRVLLPVLAELGVRRLDGVLLSHPDRDHCRGLREVSDYLPVDRIWLSPGWSGEDCAIDLMTAPGARLTPLWRGARFQVGEWRLEALHPVAGSRRGRNDRSMVMRASVRGRTLLLTGDVERAAERSLVRRASDGELRAELLKVPHHGSRGSSSRQLLGRVAPALALVSAGAGNLYGHPSRPAMERIRAAGARIVRSDRHGMVRVSIAPDGRLRFRFPGLPRP
jgi:competence protein ComEC